MSGGLSLPIASPLPTAPGGELENGTFQAIAVTPEGHTEVAIHAPRLPFGSLNIREDQ